MAAVGRPQIAWSAKGTLMFAVESGRAGAIGDSAPHRYGEWEGFIWKPGVVTESITP